MHLKQRLNTFIVMAVALVAGLLLAACGENTATGVPVTTAVLPAATTAAAVQPTTASQLSGAAATTGTAASTTTAASGKAAVSTTAPAATTAAATIATAATTTATTASAGTASTASCTRLNLNNATEAQLMSGIPGFSSRMVREFLEYRPYASILQFRRELGKYVNAAQITEWEKYVYVPVDPKTSDIETLKQLPGVDTAIATALAAGRPYASNSAVLQALSTRLTPQQVVQAACFMAA